MRGGRWAAAAVRAFALVAGLLMRGEAAPARLQADFETTATGKCRLEDGRRGNQSADSGSVTASFLARRALGPKDWYLGGGIQAENFFFGNAAGWPRRFQDCAAVFAVEYYQGDEIAGALKLRPGWYYAGRATGDAWDVPVDLVFGVPMTSDFSGVLGFSNARFYHHPLPVFGFVWKVSEHARIEGIFPEPALVVALNHSLSLRLGGELLGAGFLADFRGSRTVVEYSSYRVGAELSGTGRPGLKWALGAGIEAIRNFDFFRKQERLHGSGAGYIKLSATVLR